MTILNIILDLFNSDELGTSQHKLVYEEATIQWGILFAPYSVVVIVEYIFVGSGLFKKCLTLILKPLKSIESTF